MCDNSSAFLNNINLELFKFYLNKNLYRLLNVCFINGMFHVKHNNKTIYKAKCQSDVIEFIGIEILRSN